MINKGLAPLISLGDGVEMPQLGLGTWPMNDGEVEVAVGKALENGYRLIDTAENYGNEAGVGAGIRKSSVTRDEVFLTTKLNKNWHSFEGVQTACENSLIRLGLDYIDLFLIHWPNPEQDRFVEAYEGLETLKKRGLVRAIGTSNFKTHHLKKLFENGHVPQLNQIQVDPYHRRDDIIELHKSKGIVTESWRPLGNGNSMMSESCVKEIANNHQVSPAQVLLRWQVQQGFVTCTKSADTSRQLENISIFNFNLTEPELALLNSLGREDSEMLDSDIFGH